MDKPKGSIDAAYNPTTRSWRRLPSSPYEVRVVEGGSRVVWTGSEMLAFGMMDAALNLATNRWRPLATGGGGPSVTVWTGSQVLMWGGGCCGDSTNTGSAYDLARNVWEPMPTAPLAGRHAAGVWTGREMVVVGGYAEDKVFADGAAYNPRTRTWRMLPSLPAPVTANTITWTGTEVLVVGGHRSGTDQLVVQSSAMAYNPDTNQWRRLADMPIVRFDHMAVWAGDELLVWGGRTTPVEPGTGNYATPPYGVAYDPVANRWAPTPQSPLAGRVRASAVWTGTEMLIWGGLPTRAGEFLVDGATFRPAGPDTD
jgi:N-acetylneuraminic acid mutarotase